MAISMLSSTLVFRNITILSPRRNFCQGKSFSAKPGHPVQCIVVNTPPSKITVRRTANYQSSIWDDDYVQSLRSDYTGETCMGRFDKLKREVKTMLEKVENPLDQLELIDLMQRLGVSYQFEDEIERVLNNMYSIFNMDDEWKKENLYATALEFRILRQHGYSIPQDVFSSFKDEMGGFKVWLSEDIKGILCLYEASYLSIKGESILEESRDFAKRHLEACLLQNIDTNLDILVRHALELPLHWRMLRIEARWFIDVYEKSQHMNPILLEFSKLDYNMVQAKYHEDLKHVSWWWMDIGLGEKLSFSRDRLMENFVWALGTIFEPEFGNCRRIITKSISLITTIDDVYDLYGTLEELELFTDAVDRFGDCGSPLWEISAMDQLPEYMKICFLALYNTINEMAYDLLKEKGSHAIAYLSKSWADLCKAFLVEARWYHTGYTPTLEEYLSNAWISVSGSLILLHAYFFVTNPITEESLQCLDRNSNIIRWSSLLVRLTDDLGTSSDELKRGDVPKSIQCYMHETGASEEDAREYIKCLIDETWKKMNEDRLRMDSPFSHTFIGTTINLARISQWIYQYGDGYGIPDGETKANIISLVIEPIPLV